MSRHNVIHKFGFCHVFAESSFEANVETTTINKMQIKQNVIRVSQNVIPEY